MCEELVEMSLKLPISSVHLPVEGAKWGGGGFVGSCEPWCPLGGADSVQEALKRVVEGLSFFCGSNSFTLSPS